ncbi:MAG: hypothetical protein A2126_00625 [Candidatus Woykebacteria bacterium GWB1_45_5]|uniref:PIN domain-containing protein n=2 Tax=Candidatus Woykeibacteriota TaxID=1817899 RepID=A0A1G1W2Q0_9BACT|nr:MAG: hypothetical protein A2113_00905 [Candidatus Woykebacteria bacterium GWA1_44_8]OGY24225.1 MAG: hypothetical protein A2126_00625 [Candidatus Woykebacteria bacterium GWB1_45_5]
MIKFVLDASVILKLVLVENEQDQDIALKIIKNFQEGKAEIVLPSFWMFEVGNILIRHHEEFENLYRFILEIEFPAHDFNNRELIEIGNLAKNYQVSFYDASYYVLAKLTNSVFVTADEAYFDKAEKAGSIVLLKDLNFAD